MINRYKIIWGYEDIEKDKNGEWCKYSDVKKLEKENKQFEQKVDKLKKYISNVHHRAFEGKKPTLSILLNHIEKALKE